MMSDILAPVRSLEPPKMTLAEVLNATSEVVERVLRANSLRVDAEGIWPIENLRALQAAGLGGLVVGSDAGGLGHGLYAVARVCELLGRECPSTAITFGMHLVGSAVIDAKATPAQRAAYLGPIARGEHLTTLALSEPGTGSQFYIPQTQLTRVDGGFALRGRKSFVTSGGHADSYVISAAPTASDANPGEFSCVVVRKDAAGLTWDGQWDGWGMRGNAAVSALLDGVVVGRDDLLGEEGDEIWFVFNVIAPYFLMAMAGTYLGAAGAALDVVRAQLGERRHAHSGASLADHSVVQHRMGTMWAMVQRTRSLVYDAARMGDEGHPDALPALCSAKAEVADAAERVAADAMTLAGGRGYVDGTALQRLYRDIRAAHVMSPTTDMLRSWTGRAVLGLPILGD